MLRIILTLCILKPDFSSLHLWLLRWL